MRIFRALYRFQLFCNLFGTGRYLSPRQLRLIFDAVDILDLFICVFEPWEVEEIFCVYAFAKFKYNKVFNDISWDVDEKNPKFDGQRPPTPEGAFDLGNSCQYCTSQHPLLLVRVYGNIDPEYWADLLC